MKKILNKMLCLLIIYENIKSFTQNHNMELLSLTKNTMIDIGSIIPIA